MKNLKLYEKFKLPKQQNQIIDKTQQIIDNHLAKCGMLVMTVVTNHFFFKK